MEQQFEGHHNRRSNRRIPIYLISLLLHVIAFLLFLLYCFKPHQPVTISKEQEQEQETFFFSEPEKQVIPKQEEPDAANKEKDALPALHAKDTNLGFPDGENPPTLQELDNQHDSECNTEQQYESQSKQETEQPIEQPSDLPTAENIEAQDEESQDQKIKNEPQEIVEKITPQQQTTFLDEKRIAQLKKEYKKARIQAKARKKRIKQIIANDQHIKEQVERIRIQEEQIAQQKSPKKSTILARTKGFIESWAEPGNDAFSCSGLNKPVTGFEDYREQRYDAQIFWKAQKAWHNNHFHNRKLPQNKAYLMIVEAEIDTKGNLVSFTILKSTGVADIDHDIKQAFKLASPFDPIPKHLNETIHRYASTISVESKNPALGWQ